LSYIARGDQVVGGEPIIGGGQRNLNEVRADSLQVTIGVAVERVALLAEYLRVELAHDPDPQAA
jgi:hypothetical protein